MASGNSWRGPLALNVVPVAAIAMLAAACFAVTQALPAPAERQKDGSAKKPSDWLAPPSATAVKNPVPADAASLATGKSIYMQQCQACHGETGKGDGPVAADLSPPPSDLTDPKMWEQTDGSLFWKITEGRGPMPSYKSLLTDTQRWHVVNFIRTLAPKRPKESGRSRGDSATP